MTLYVRSETLELTSAGITLIFICVQVSDLKVLVDRKDTILSPAVPKVERGEKGDRGEPGSRGPSGADVSVTKTCSAPQELHLLFYHFLCNIQTVEGNTFKVYSRLKLCLIQQASKDELLSHTQLNVFVGIFFLYVGRTIEVSLYNATFIN